MKLGLSLITFNAILALLNTSVIAKKNKCPQFNDPRNGYMVCDHLIGAFCAPVCKSGYEPVELPALSYVCNTMSGRWATYPAGYPLPWPDCQRKTTRSSLHHPRSGVPTQSPSSKRSDDPGLESLWQKMLKLTSDYHRQKVLAKTGQQRSFQPTSRPLPAKSVPNIETITRYNNWALKAIDSTEASSIKEKIQQIELEHELEKMKKKTWLEMEEHEGLNSPVIGSTRTVGPDVPSSIKPMTEKAVLNVKLTPDASKASAKSNLIESSQGHSSAQQSTPAAADATTLPRAQAIPPVPTLSPAQLEYYDSYYKSLQAEWAKYPATSNYAMGSPQFGAAQTFLDPRVGNPQNPNIEHVVNVMSSPQSMTLQSDINSKGRPLQTGTVNVAIEPLSNTNTNSLFAPPFSNVQPMPPATGPQIEIVPGFQATQILSNAPYPPPASAGLVVNSIPASPSSPPASLPNYSFPVVPSSPPALLPPQSPSPPPALPAVQGISVQPALSAVQSIPNPPAIPAVQNIPNPPSSPAVQSIPIPPALPTIQSVTNPPALPSVQSIPNPPASPYNYNTVTTSYNTTLQSPVTGSSQLPPGSSAVPLQGTNTTPQSVSAPQSKAGINASVYKPVTSNNSASTKVENVKEQPLSSTTSKNNTFIRPKGADTSKSQVNETRPPSQSTTNAIEPQNNTTQPVVLRPKIILNPFLEDQEDLENILEKDISVRKGGKVFNNPYMLVPDNDATTLQGQYYPPGTQASSTTQQDVSKGQLASNYRPVLQQPSSPITSAETMVSPVATSNNQYQTLNTEKGLSSSSSYPISTTNQTYPQRYAVAVNGRNASGKQDEGGEFFIEKILDTDQKSLPTPQTATQDFYKEDRYLTRVEQSNPVAKNVTASVPIADSTYPPPPYSNLPWIYMKNKAKEEANKLQETSATALQGQSQSTSTTTETTTPATIVNPYANAYSSTNQNQWAKLGSSTLPVVESTLSVDILPNGLQTGSSSAKTQAQNIDNSLKNKQTANDGADNRTYKATTSTLNRGVASYDLTNANKTANGYNTASNLKDSTEMKGFEQLREYLASTGVVRNDSSASNVNYQTLPSSGPSSSYSWGASTSSAARQETNSYQQPEQQAWQQTMQQATQQTSQKATQQTAQQTAAKETAQQTAAKETAQQVPATQASAQQYQAGTEAKSSSPYVMPTSTGMTTNTQGVASSQTAPTSQSAVTAFSEPTSQSGTSHASKEQGTPFGKQEEPELTDRDLMGLDISSLIRQLFKLQRLQRKEKLRQALGSRIVNAALNNEGATRRADSATQWRFKNEKTRYEVGLRKHILDKASALLRAQAKNRVRKVYPLPKFN